MAKRRGAGTVVALGSTDDPLTAVFTAIPQIKSVRLNMSTGEQEVTTLDNTAKEYIRDLPDGGTMTIVVIYDPAQATHNEIAGLEALFNNGETRAFRITPNGATKHTFVKAFVRSDDQGFEPNSPMEKTCECRVTGGRTYAAV